MNKLIDDLIAAESLLGCFLSDVTSDAWRAVLLSEQTLDVSDILSTHLSQDINAEKLEMYADRLTEISRKAVQISDEYESRALGSKRISSSESMTGGENDTLWTSYFLQREGEQARLRSIVCILAHCIGCDDANLNVAGAKCYMQLFNFPNWDAQRSMLFQTGIFRKVFKNLLKLRDIEKGLGMQELSLFIKKVSLGRTVESVRYVFDTLIGGFLCRPFDDRATADFVENHNAGKPQKASSVFPYYDYPDFIRSIYGCLESIISHFPESQLVFVVSYVFKALLPLLNMTVQDPLPQTLSKLSHHKARLAAGDFLHRIAVEEYPIFCDRTCRRSVNQNDDESGPPLDEEKEHKEEKEQMQKQKSGADGEKDPDALEADDENSGHQHEGDPANEKSLQESPESKNGRNEDAKKSVEETSRQENATQDNIDQQTGVKLPPKVTLDPYLAVLQNLCILCPDRADFRTGLADTIVNALKRCPNERIVTELVHFLESLMGSDVSSRRQIASEVLATVLEGMSGSASDSQNENYQHENGQTPTHCDFGRSNSKDMVNDNCINGNNMNGILPTIMEDDMPLLPNPQIGTSSSSSSSQVPQASSQLLHDFNQKSWVGTPVRTPAKTPTRRETTSMLKKNRSPVITCSMPPHRTKTLISGIISRTRDTIPNVRGKALQSVALALLSNPEDLLRGKRLQIIGQLFRERMVDSKAVVRKAALTFLDTLLPALIQVFRERSEVDTEAILASPAGKLSNISPRQSSQIGGSQGFGSQTHSQGDDGFSQGLSQGVGSQSMGSQPMSSQGMSSQTQGLLSRFAFQGIGSSQPMRGTQGMQSSQGSDVGVGPPDLTDDVSFRFIRLREEENNILEIGAPHFGEGDEVRVKSDPQIWERLYLFATPKEKTVLAASQDAPGDSQAVPAGSPNDPNVMDVDEDNRVFPKDEDDEVDNAALGFSTPTSKKKNAERQPKRTGKWDCIFPLELIAAATGDDSVMVRKSALATLGNLLKQASSVATRQTWSQSVLPCVVDVEASVSEKALEEVDRTIFQPIIKTQHRVGRTKNSSSSGETHNHSVYLLLRDFNPESTEYLQRATVHLLKMNPGGAKELVTAMENIMKQSCLQPDKVLPPDAILDLFDEITGQVVIAGKTKVAGETPQKTATQGKSAKQGAAPGRSDSVSYGDTSVDTKLVLDIWERLLCATLHPPVRRYYTNKARDRVLEKLIRILGNCAPLLSKLEQEATADQLIEKILKFCENYPVGLLGEVLQTIQKFRKSSSGYKYDFTDLKNGVCETALSLFEKSTDFTEERVRIKRHLFMLGELAMIGEPIRQNVITALQAICSDDCYYDNSKLQLPDSVRAHAVIVFGKLCIKNEKLAKSSIEVLVYFLTVENEGLCIKNNILIVLGDLARCYTSLVDRFVPLMTDFLGHKDTMLRKNAVMILTSLIAEDFIKFRDDLTARLFFMLADSDVTIREFVECVFLRILHPRNDKMFEQQMLPTVCNLNGYADVAQFGRDVSPEFMNKSRHFRFRIYSFMLMKMKSDQKFSVVQMIIQVFFAAFVDGDKPVAIPARNSPGGRTICDCFAILMSKEMRVCFSARTSGTFVSAATAAATREAGGCVEDMEQAKQKFFQDTMKKTILENLLPTLVLFKEKMERSPLQKELLECLRDMLCEYVSDLDQYCDPRLVQEIKYDLESGKKRNANKLPILEMADLPERAAEEEPEGAFVSPVRVEQQNKEDVELLAAQTNSKFCEVMGTPLIVPVVPGVTPSSIFSAVGLDGAKRRRPWNTAGQRNSVGSNSAVPNTADHAGTDTNEHHTSAHDTSFKASEMGTVVKPGKEQRYSMIPGYDSDANPPDSTNHPGNSTPVGVPSGIPWSQRKVDAHRNSSVQAATPSVSSSAVGSSAVFASGKRNAYGCASGNRNSIGAVLDTISENDLHDVGTRCSPPTKKPRKDKSRKIHFDPDKIAASSSSSSAGPPAENVRSSPVHHVKWPPEDNVRLSPVDHNRSSAVEHVNSSMNSRPSMGVSSSRDAEDAGGTSGRDASRTSSPTDNSRKAVRRLSGGAGGGDLPKPNFSDPKPDSSNAGCSLNNLTHGSSSVNNVTRNGSSSVNNVTRVRAKASAKASANSSAKASAAMKKAVKKRTLASMDDDSDNE